MDPVTAFADLFIGSDEGYGTEAGGCDKDTSVSYYERIVYHLEGDVPMGVYPLRNLVGDGWCVHWGCVDFDEGEDKSLAYAANVAQVITAMGGVGYVERSRSKGYHVWLFLDGWYPAVLVREALLGACQTVGAPTKEINPKSVSLAEGQLGNYVRLPYPGAYAEDGRFPADRRVMIQEGVRDPVPFEWFVQQALEHRAGASVLESLRSLYQAPVRIVAAPAGPVGEGDMYKRMGGLAWTVYKDGPLDGGGRGHTLFKLACLLAEDGNHTQGEALAICIEADQRWGKFHERANGEVTIEGIVRKAFGS